MMKKLYKYLYEEDEMSFEDFEKYVYIFGAIGFMSLIFTLLIKLG